MKPLLVLALLLSAAAPVHALEPRLSACDPSPVLRPMAELPGEALLDMDAELRDGRVLRKTYRIVRGLPDRRAQRMAIATVDMVMGATVCHGVTRLRARVVVGPTRAGFEAMETEPAPGAIRQN